MYPASRITLLGDANRSTHDTVAQNAEQSFKCVEKSKLFIAFHDVTKM
ncbi:hypothetical protein FCR2A7T_25970 [Flavobacterium cauense R2A-7]|nr:hypothetical protein [Flavobacterium cauense]ESU19174.1 hypothetical protein FCR2A7T_25970 [Flavobacterium cauense R2A-7]